MSDINTDPKKFPEQEKDLQERMDGFNKELLPLLGKYELGLAAIPKIVGDGRIAADPVIVSVRKAQKDAQAKADAEAGAPVTPNVEGGIENPDA